MNIDIKVQIFNQEIHSSIK